MKRSLKPRLLILVVAYHAETTIKLVLRRIPIELSQEYQVEILIIDDASADRTFYQALEADKDPRIPFKITSLYNPINQGYGGNQKIGYHYAIRFGFNFVALLHGDGQYAPEALPALVRPLKEGWADAVFGSRMMRPKDALKGGMPRYKFIGNKILTKLQNRLLGLTLTEFHSGYRVYSVNALVEIPFERNTNDFHFDTEIIIQLHLAGKRFVELPISTHYGGEICRVNGLAYAKEVIRASLQAKLQRAHIFFDRRFDCAPTPKDGTYPSKLDFDSTHRRIVELVRPGARVLDLGSGTGAVGKALKEEGCYVVGCDVRPGPMTAEFDRFVQADLDAALPDFGSDKFEFILCLDVIEHLRDPEEFLDRLREIAARMGAEVLLTTANIGFVLMRLSLLIGRFEYGKRGILDLTHVRLFTFATIRRAMRAAGFDISATEGIVVPLPFILGDSSFSRALIRLNALLVKFRPKLFGFQILVRARARPSLDTLLEAAHRGAVERAVPVDPKSADTRNPLTDIDADLARQSWPVHDRSISSISQ